MPFANSALTPPLRRPIMKSRFFYAASVLLMLGACGVYEYPTGTTILPWQVWFSTSDVTVAAGMAEIQPATSDTLSGSVSLARFGSSRFDTVYELETPAATDFSFTVVARGAGNVGMTRLALGHVADNGAVPSLGAESIVAAGMHLEGGGLSYNGDLVEVTGDGFSRVTVRGNISQSQVLLVRVPRDNQPPLNIGIRIRIGNQSAINLPNFAAPAPHPAMTTTAIYSTNSWYAGLPAIAVSGDRYSVVTYDGDNADYGQRQRRWLQLDGQTQAVTGGEAPCYSDDAGGWRDQEVAAQGNVLAVAYCQAGQVHAEVSLDRGATFPITRMIEDQNGWGAQRLVQVAIGPDYTLGVMFWRFNYYGTTGQSTLCLVEGTPTGFDANNTPTGYQWGAPQSLHAPNQDVTPLLMHMEYSQGGDLAVAYGYTYFATVGSQRISSARYRYAVREFGQAWRGGEVDHEDNVVPSDPHVAVLGSGSTMEVFYAYEKSDGIYLKHSANAGVTWQNGATVAIAGAIQPTVHPRMVGGLKRVDLLYCAPCGWGYELHDLHWDDFTPGAQGTPYGLTQVSATAGGTAPPGCPTGMRIRTLAWFGYDAVIKGDKVAVVVHELNNDIYGWWNMWGVPAFMGWPTGGGFVAASGGSGSASYTPAPPPAVLLPGMNGTVPAPNQNDRSVMSVIVID